MAALKLVLPFLLAAPLLAQTGPFGTWTLATAPDLTQVIEGATASMNFVTRPIARGRLKKTNEAYKRIQIAKAGAEITIQYEGRLAQHMAADGQASKWKREDGEEFMISARLDKDDLIQTYKAEDGERSNVFHFDPKTGTLSLSVTVKSGKLPKPLTYTLTYKAG
jgi:hypothetical protein